MKKFLNARFPIGLRGEGFRPVGHFSSPEQLSNIASMSELKNGPLPNNDNNANGPPEPAGVLWIKNNLFSPNLPRIPGVSRLIYLNVSSFLSGFMLSFSYDHQCHVRLIIAPRDREVSSLFFMGKYSFTNTITGWIEMLASNLSK